MSMTPEIRRELNELLGMLRDGRLDEDRLARLDSLVAAEPDARRLYINYVDLCASLHWTRREKCDGDGISYGDNEKRTAEDWDFGDLETPASLLAVSPFSLSTPPGSSSAPFVGGPVFSYMVASVLLCLMLLGAWSYKVVRQESFPSHIVEHRDPLIPTIVGQITGMKDCRWSNDSLGTIIGASVPLGRKYSLESGLLQITYKTGANVILEGPCIFKADSAVGGYLDLGRLTARVEKIGERREEGGEGSVGLAASAAIAKPQAVNSQSLAPSPQSPAPLFSVTTPTAVVTDLGTEFGVEVNERGDTTSHVFKGSVRVDIVGDNKQQGIILGANASARVLKGNGGLRLFSGEAVADVPDFVTKLPGPTKKLDPTWFIDGNIFQDDFNGDSIDSDKWDVVVKNERSIPGGSISPIDGCAVFCTHDQEDAETLKNSDRMIYDTPGKRKIAFLQSKPGQLDFSRSPDDWWAEIRFQFTGNLDSPNWSPEWRTWAILSGVVDKYYISVFDLRAIQRGAVDSDEFNLGWFHLDEPANSDGNTPLSGEWKAQKLRTGLKKGKFYTIAVHRKSDATLDVYLDGELIAVRPMIGAVNPKYLFAGDIMPWNIAGTCKIDYVKVGALIKNETQTDNEPRKGDRPMK